MMETEIVISLQGSQGAVGPEAVVFAVVKRSSRGGSPVTFVGDVGVPKL